MIRFAVEKDVPAIMNFIDQYWHKGHIMSHDRILFDFQHKWGNEISFVISEENGFITGILGYIPYGDSNRDITLAIWKANKTKDAMQGINILSYLRENGNVRSISAPGINPKTIPIYDFLGIDTGKMKQWYRLRDKSKYKIALVTNDEIPAVSFSDDISIEEINDFSDAELKFGIEDCLYRNHQLIKSKEYLRRRYFEHPYFSYIKYGLKRDNQKLFVVLRVQKCNGSALIRVIDCIGDLPIFIYFTPQIDDLLIRYDCEYADCYETGVLDDYFFKGGWRLVAESGNIIPEYFAPFECRNIDIFYMSEIKRVVLFKGDGDMDRPN